MTCHPCHVYQMSPIAARWEENGTTTHDIDLYEIKKYYKPEAIIKIVCDFLDMKVEEVCSKEHHRQIAYARYVCVYFLKKKTMLSDTDIGKMFKGKKKGTTQGHHIVRNAMRHIKDLIDCYDLVRNQIYSLEQILL